MWPIVAISKSITVPVLRGIALTGLELVCALQEVQNCGWPALDMYSICLTVSVIVSVA